MMLMVMCFADLKKMALNFPSHTPLTTMSNSKVGHPRKRLLSYFATCSARLRCAIQTDKEKAMFISKLLVQQATKASLQFSVV